MRQPMKRDFASLSAQEALHLAIYVEERNGGLYSQFSELFKHFGDRNSLEIADVFLDMAYEERRHGAMLQMRYAERYGDETCSLTEEDVRPLLELPRLSDGSIFAIARAGASSAPSSHALEVALAAEKSAQRFYTHLLQYTDDPDLRALYSELSEFEDAHVALLTRRMQALRRDLPEQA